MSDARTSSSPLEAAPEPQKRRVPWPVIKGTLKVMFTMFGLWFFVLPLIPGFRKAWSDLNDVNPALIGAGFALEILALLCYSLLTRAALPPTHVSFFRLFRIQMTTKSLSNVVPAGSAAGSALGYRLMTLSGISGPDAGFALATVGLGSAVVLNLLLLVDAGHLDPDPRRQRLLRPGRAHRRHHQRRRRHRSSSACMRGQERAERIVRWIGEQGAHRS